MAYFSFVSIFGSISYVPLTTSEIFTHHLLAAHLRHTWRGTCRHYSLHSLSTFRFSLLYSWCSVDFIVLRFKESFVPNQVFLCNSNAPNWAYVLVESVVKANVAQLSVCLTESVVNANYAQLSFGCMTEKHAQLSLNWMKVRSSCLIMFGNKFSWLQRNVWLKSKDAQFYIYLTRKCFLVIHLDS